MSEAEWKALFADSNFAKYQMDLCLTEGLLDSNYKMEEKVKIIIDGNKIKTEAMTGHEGLEFNLDDLLKKSTKDVNGYDSKYDNLLKDYIRETLLNHLGLVGDNGNYTVGDIFTAAIPSYYEINQDGTLYNYEMSEYSNGYQKELISNSGTGSIASFIDLFKPAKDFYSKVTFNEKTGEYSFKASDILSAYADEVKDMVTGGTVTYKINNNKISSVVFDLTVSEDTFIKITQDFTYENKSVTLPSYYLLSEEDSFNDANVRSNTDTCYLSKLCSIGLLKHDYDDKGYCKVCGAVDNDTLEIVKVPELEAIAGDFFTVYKDKYGDLVGIDYDYDKEEYVDYIYFYEISKSLNIHKTTIGDETIYFGTPSSSVHYTDGCTQGYNYTLYMLEGDGETYFISYSIDYKSKSGNHEYGFTVTPIDDTCTATVHGECSECGQECEFVIEYHNAKTVKSEVGPFYKYAQTCEDCGLTNTYYVFDYDKEDDVEYVLNYKDGKYSGYMYEKEKPDVHYDLVGIDYVNSDSDESNFTAIFKVEDGLSYVEFNMDHDDDANGYCKHCGTFMQYRYLDIPEPGDQKFCLIYNADNEIVDYYIGLSGIKDTITSGDYTIDTTTYGNITEGEGNIGAKVTIKYLTADKDKCIYNSDITIEYYLDGELVDTVSYKDEGDKMYHSCVDPEIICEFELDLLFTSFDIVIAKCNACEEIYVVIV